MIRRIALGLVTAIAVPVAMVRAARWSKDARAERERRASVDKVIARSDARLDAGLDHEALAVLLDALGHASGEPDSRLTDATARLLEDRGAHRAVAALRLSRNEFAAVVVLEKSAPREAALAAWRKGDHADAARRFDALGEPVHAAIAFERAGDHAQALDRWERVARDARVAGDPYLGALCATKRGRALRAVGEVERALTELRRAIDLARSVYSEADAHAFDRGFDAASLVGRIADEVGDSKTYRESMERCVSHLEANRPIYALQYCVALARRLRDSEHPIESAHVLARGVEFATEIEAAWETPLAHATARAFEQAARASFERNAFDDARIAWEEAARRFAERHVFDRAAKALEDLAAIPTLEPAVRADAIARAKSWRVKESPSGMQPLPDWATAPPAMVTIEDDDLLAMENAGDGVRVCGDLLAASTDGDLSRRVALALIEALDPPTDDPSVARKRALDALTRVGHYPVLDVFERSLRDDDPAVRASGAESLRIGCFAKTFVLLRRALGDPDLAVRRAATVTLRRLDCCGGTESVIAIARTATDVSARSAALASLGCTHHDAAVDALLDFALSGDADVRSLSTSFVVSHPHGDTDRRIRFAFARAEQRILAATTTDERSRAICDAEVLNAMLVARHRNLEDRGDDPPTASSVRMRQRLRSLRKRRAR